MATEKPIVLETTRIFQSNKLQGPVSVAGSRSGREQDYRRPEDQGGLKAALQRPPALLRRYFFTLEASFPRHLKSRVPGKRCRRAVPGALVVERSLRGRAAGQGSPAFRLPAHEVQ